MRGSAVPASCRLLPRSKHCCRLLPAASCCNRPHLPVCLPVCLLLSRLLLPQSPCSASALPRPAIWSSGSGWTAGGRAQRGSAGWERRRCGAFRLCRTRPPVAACTVHRHVHTETVERHPPWTACCPVRYHSTSILNCCWCLLLHQCVCVPPVCPPTHPHPRLQHPADDPGAAGSGGARGCRRQRAHGGGAGGRGRGSRGAAAAEGGSGADAGRAVRWWGPTCGKGCCGGWVKNTTQQLCSFSPPLHSPGCLPALLFQIVYRLRLPCAACMVTQRWRLSVRRAADV